MWYVLFLADPHPYAYCFAHPYAYCKPSNTILCKLLFYAQNSSLHNLSQVYLPLLRDVSHGSRTTSNLKVVVRDPCETSRNKAICTNLGGKAISETFNSNCVKALRASLHKQTAIGAKQGLVGCNWYAEWAAHCLPVLRMQFVASWYPSRDPTRELLEQSTFAKGRAKQRYCAKQNKLVGRKSFQGFNSFIVLWKLVVRDLSQATRNKANGTTWPKQSSLLGKKQYHQLLLMGTKKQFEKGHAIPSYKRMQSNKRVKPYQLLWKVVLFGTLIVSQATRTVTLWKLVHPTNASVASWKKGFSLASSCSCTTRVVASWYPSRAEQNKDIGLRSHAQAIGESLCVAIPFFQERKIAWSQRTQKYSGKVAERFMATDCKSVDLFIVGSNPTFPTKPCTCLCKENCLLVWY